MRDEGGGGGVHNGQKKRDVLYGQPPTDDRGAITRTPAAVSSRFPFY